MSLNSGLGAMEECDVGTQLAERILSEFSLLREDVSETSRRQSEDLRQWLETVKSQQEMLTEAMLGWQRKIEASIDKQLSPRVGLRSSSSATPKTSILLPHTPVEGFVLCNPPGTPTEAEVEEGEEIQVPIDEPLPIVPSADRNNSKRPTKQNTTLSLLPPEPPKSKMATTASHHEKKKKLASSKRHLFKGKQAEVLAGQSLLQSLTRARWYEWASMALIFLNSLTIGWQVQAAAHSTVGDFDVLARHDGSEPAFFLAMQTLFCIVFAAELSLRWAAEGLVEFVLNADAAWNVFDIVIVIAGILETGIELSVQGKVGSSSISVIRILRVLRVVRILRALRLLSFFRELRLMLCAITTSLKSFLWSMMVLILMFYIFGLTMTVGASEHLSKGEGQSWYRDNLQLREFFGTLDVSMFSLFMAMSGGRDWYEFYDSLIGVGFAYRAMFVFSVAFSIFALSNVLAAAFVESALQASGHDRETLIKEELETQTQYLSRIRELFEEMDLDNTGTLSIEEFEKHLDDDRVIAYFNTLKLDVSDARMLFMLLDRDRSGSIDIDEFVNGCHRLKGESRTLDIAIIRYELAWLRSYVMASDEEQQEAST